MPNAPRSPHGRLPWRAVIGGAMIGLAGATFIGVTYPREATLATIALAVAAVVYLAARAVRYIPKRAVVSNAPGVSYDTKPRLAPPRPAGRSSASPARKSKDRFAYDPARFAPRKERERTDKLTAIAHHPETPEAERKAAEQKLSRRRGRKGRKA